MTAQEQSRAFDAMTRRVANLRNELNGAGQAMSRLDRARNWGSNATAIAGGVAAAGAVVAPSITNQVSYEQRLAMMANTAFSDENTTGRRAGMQQMDQLIRRSVAVGGGNKESAAETLDTLLASGAVDFKSAERLLPSLQKYSTATGADPKDLAQIAIRLKQNFGISDEQIPTALNMAIKAGQLGSFELKDMAKWLPQQLAAANALGMRGLGDFGVMLGVNQASMISAGTPDEAGNNFVNLLTKINSQDAANAAARIKYNGKGIDLPGSLVAARGKGINAIDAFSGIVDKVVGNNPAYKKLESQLKNTTDGSERREIMESQAKLLEGSAIGQIVADRQALMALVAYRANKQYALSVIQGVNGERALPLNNQAGEQNFDLMQGTAGYQFNQLNNTRDFSQMDAVKPLSDVMAGLAQELNDYGNAYPGLTKAMAGAELAIKAMTVAAITFSGIKFIGALGGAAGAASEAGAGAATAAGSSGWLSRIARAGGKVLAPLALWQAANDAPLVQVDRGDAEARARLRSGSSTDPLLDTMKSKPGLLDAWDEMKSWWSPPTNISLPSTANGYPVPPFAQPQQPMQPINITTKLEVDGRVLAESVNEVNGQSAARGQQGGPH
ncbi:phage tail tape measure protein [Candidatus Pantoea formicae]|uniref:phage tail tape measure protein n=1 Tax=Candidatus Pantoea formicae TaxID=2608355 RepID=UPI003EDAD53B